MTDHPTVLAIRPGALGDALLALPALRGLRLRFPSASLHLVGNPGAGAVLQAAGEIEGFADFDRPELLDLFSPRESVALFDALRPIDAAVAWLGDGDGTIGTHLRRLGAERVLVAPSRPPTGVIQHAADYLLASLAAWGVSTPEWRALSLPDPDRLAWEESFDVLIHPGSGSAAKNWPAERFADVANLLSRERTTRVAMICGPADESACAAVQRHGASDLQALRTPAVPDLARLLVQTRAYLGNDSGVSHLAAALGTPSVALFGPTDPRIWAPLGPSVCVLPFDVAPFEVAEATRRAMGGGPRFG